MHVKIKKETYVKIFAENVGKTRVLHNQKLNSVIKTARILEPPHWMKMAALYWLVFLGSLCIGTVESAGYLYRMPHHGDVCYYEDLENAHFSYDQETCRSKSFVKRGSTAIKHLKWVFFIKKRKLRIRLQISYATKY